MRIADSDIYRTDISRSRSFLQRIILGRKFMFYPQIFWIILTNSLKATRGIYNGKEWVKSSGDILRTLENVGVVFEITGMKNISSFEGPAVFVSNHMSTLETFVLPYIIQPVKPITFVVKKSLVKTPIFGPIMRSRDPIIVGRKNPREDFKIVLEEGTKRLKAGISLVIFPQGMRTLTFNADEFNTLGVKLASKAGVPVVPIALKTDAWGIGKIIKDFGRLDVNKKVYFAFGEPMQITGRGAEEHAKTIRFIQEKLSQWSSLH